MTRMRRRCARVNPFFRFFSSFSLFHLALACNAVRSEYALLGDYRLTPWLIPPYTRTLNKCGSPFRTAPTLRVAWVHLLHPRSGGVNT